MIEYTIKIKKQADELKERCKQIKSAINVMESYSDPNESLKATRDYLYAQLNEFENIICTYENRLKEQHQNSMVLIAQIAEFAERKVPADWERWGLDRRRDFWAGVAHAPEGSQFELVERDRICALEVWCELFNGSVKNMTQANAREINAVLSNLTGWERNNNPLRFGPHRQQRGYVCTKNRIKLQQYFL